MGTAEKQRPNILWLVSDQHSAAYMGMNGKARVDTPNLDGLARRGVYFDNAYCQNPLCVPSRASMLTGRYSRNIGIYDNRHILESNLDTLPRVLARDGYTTCLIGKAHVNGEQFQGFDQRPYGDLLGQSHQPEGIRRGCESPAHGLGDLLTNSGETSIPLPMTQTEICVSESVKWLGRHRNRAGESPFFLSVNFEKPHFPYRAPARYYAKYAGRTSLPDSPANYANVDAVPFVRNAFMVNGGWEHYGTDAEVHLRALAAYSACVEWVDDAVGRILESLSYLGLAENTIIVYSSDHGEMAGQKGAWQKTVFFDHSSKVPLIISIPGAPVQASRSDRIVGLVDLYPTLCSLAGVKAPAGCDGIDLSPILRGEGVPARSRIFSESTVLTMPEQSGCMMRSERYKYCLYLDGGNELYDLREDPEELVNLSGNPAMAQVENAMRKEIIDFWDPEEQLNRYHGTPMMKREKHFYLYSNQFVGSDGTMTDAYP